MPRAATSKIKSERVIPTADDARPAGQIQTEEEAEADRNEALAGMREEDNRRAADDLANSTWMPEGAQYPDHRESVEGAKWTHKGGPLRTGCGASAPDIAAIEDLLTNFASERAPMVLRQGIELERATERAREIEADLETVRSRRALVDRLYQTVCEGLDAERADLDAALSILQNGVVGASTGK